MTMLFDLCQRPRQFFSFLSLTQSCGLPITIRYEETIFHFCMADTIFSRTEGRFSASEALGSWGRCFLPRADPSKVTARFGRVPRALTDAIYQNKMDIYVMYKRPRTPKLARLITLWPRMSAVRRIESMAAICLFTWPLIRTVRFYGTEEKRVP